jgi:hypothetical protein
MKGMSEMKKKNELARTTSEPITFPKDLLVPPQTQVQQYEDAVSRSIRELDAAASQLAHGFGIGYSPGMNLDELPQQEKSDLLILLAAAFVSTKRVTLEKINGTWGLVYSYEPGVVRPGNDRGYRVPLRDAPLEIREKFLHRSEEFFRRYLATCQDRLGTMKVAVDAGSRTLALLRNVQLS